MASILGVFQAAQTRANQANLARYKEGIGLYDQMITNWGKGGGFVKGAEATLERTKKKDMASGMQSLVSSGLVNTTMSAGLGKKWEEEVGAPARLNIADVAGQRLMQAQREKAGFIERRTDSGPDPSMVSSLMQGMGRSSGSQSSGELPGFGWFNKGKATKSVRQPSIASSTVYGRKKQAPQYNLNFGAKQVGSSYYGSAFKGK